MSSMCILSAIAGGGGILDVIPSFALTLSLLLISYFVLNIILKPFGVLSLVPAMLCGVICGKTILGNITSGWHFGTVLESNKNLSSFMILVCAISIGFLLFESGLKTSGRLDWKNIRRNSYLIIAVGLGATVCIFLLTVFLAIFYFSIKEAFAIAALAMIAAVVTIAAILKDLGIRCSEEADPIFAICAMNEIVSWIFINSIISFYSGNVDMYTGILLPALSTLLATTFCLAIGRDLAHRIFSKIPKKKEKILLLCICMTAFVYISSVCGIGFLYAFFLAGLLLGKPGTIPEDVRDIVIELLVTIFVPIFFMNVVLQFDLLQIKSFMTVLFLIAYFFVIKGVINYIFAYVSTRSAWFSMTIAIALIPGGAIEISVARVFQEVGILSENTFLAVVVHVLISALACGSVLRAHLRLKKIDLEKHLTSSFIFARGKRKYLWAESHPEEQWQIIQNEFLEKLSDTLAQFLDKKGFCISRSAILMSLKDNTSNWVGRKIRGRYLVFTCDLPALTQTWIVPACMHHLEGIKVEEGDEDEILYVFVILCPPESGNLSFTSNIGAMIKSKELRTRILDRYEKTIDNLPSISHASLELMIQQLS